MIDNVVGLAYYPSEDIKKAPARATRTEAGLDEKGDPDGRG